MTSDFQNETAAPADATPAALWDAIHEALETSQPQIVLSQFDPLAVDDAWTAVMESGLSNARSRQASMSRTALRLPWAGNLAHKLYYDYWDIHGASEIAYIVREATFFEDLGDHKVMGFAAETVTTALSILGRVNWAEEPARAALIARYFLGGCTRPELGQLGLARNLTLEDKYLVLSLILRSNTAHQLAEAMARPHRVCLFLDEVENILSAEPRQVAALATALLRLSGDSGDDFTLWLNVADERSEALDQVKAALGTRFLEFVTHDLTRPGVSRSAASPALPSQTEV